MRPRPLAITVLGWLFVVVCTIGLGYHLMPQHAKELTGPGASPQPLLWVIAIRLLGVIAGVFLLLGHNWARWLLAAWVAYHVGLSAMHSAFEVAVHGLLFIVVLYFLFRKGSAGYFAAHPVPAAQRPDPS